MKKDFTWGVATSAYQVEGAWREDGKGRSIWDAFTHTPGRILTGQNGDIACDQYHLYPRDVELMRELGVNAYRFSVSWPRIIPDGKGRINPAGIDYYNRLIDCLLENGIRPFVTLYHWDLPLALQAENDGWLSYETAEAFARYAGICFQAFGGRVKHWTTFNENWCTAVLGYGKGIFAPGHASPDEPYLAGHNLLLAHGLAVREFREKGYAGQIGIVNNCDWREPLTDAKEDIAAAHRSLEFSYGWFTDPVVFGNYPAIMYRTLGKRLPEFSRAQEQMLKGSVDFLGLNHYSTQYASAQPPAENSVSVESGKSGVTGNQDVYLSCDPEWKVTGMDWFVVPWGFRKALNWIDQRYLHPPLYVTENGAVSPCGADKNEFEDDFRADFIEAYTGAMQTALERDGVNVQGYFCWSLLDNFEWVFGYSMRFGLVYTDFETLERTPKNSFYRYRDIIRNASC